MSQVNPTGDTLSWGLFGLLGEGVAPFRAFNLTGEVFDEPQTVDELELWAKILIACAAVLAGIFVGMLAVRLCRGKGD